MPETWLNDPEFIGPVGSDVMGALQRSRFFERLDDRLCPANPTQPAIACGHSFANTIRILRDLAIDLNELQDVIGYLRVKGARCDCEVLGKVAEHSRFKTHCAESGRSELGCGPT
jgi:hypothetical protein